MAQDDEKVNTKYKCMMVGCDNYATHLMQNSRGHKLRLCLKCKEGKRPPGLKIKRTRRV